MAKNYDPAVDDELRGMTPRKFAQKYGLSASSVYQACRTGDIPNVRVGNRYVILWEQWEKKASGG